MQHAVLRGQRADGHGKMTVQPPGHQPDDALVPARAAHEQHAPGNEIMHVRLRHGFVHRLGLQVLAARVGRVQLRGKRRGLRGIGGQQQAHGGVRIPHAARRVQPRRKLKPHLPFRHGLPDVRRGHQRRKAQACWDQLQTQRGDDAVFPGQRYDIGDGGNGGQRQQLLEHVRP